MYDYVLSCCLPHTSTLPLARAFPRWSWLKTCVLCVVRGSFSPQRRRRALLRELTDSPATICIHCHSPLAIIIMNYILFTGVYIVWYSCTRLLLLGAHCSWTVPHTDIVFWYRCTRLLRVSTYSYWVPITSWTVLTLALYRCDSWLTGQISWVLYSRLVYCREETDVPILSRKGWPQENVQESMGETSCSVWTAFRLYSIFCCMVTYHFSHCTIDILCVQLRVILIVIIYLLQVLFIINLKMKMVFTLKREGY